MKIVPSDKLDIEACSELSNANDELVLKHLSELFEWLQDPNWPVSKPIAIRLSKLGIPLVKEINKAISGSDQTLKYSILTILYPLLTTDVIIKVKPALERLALNPTQDEKLEELDLVSKEILNL